MTSHAPLRAGLPYNTIQYTKSTPHLFLPYSYSKPPTYKGSLDSQTSTTLSGDSNRKQKTVTKIEMPFITQVLHVPQVLLSAYGLYVSYISITNLRQYEEKSEKAAEWSSAAEHQLHKTRTTQASGAITVSLHIYSPPPALLVYVYMHFCVRIYVYVC